VASILRATRFTRFIKLCPLTRETTYPRKPVEGISYQIHFHQPLKLRFDEL
jgi:hypothetical protein